MKAGRETHDGVTLVSTGALSAAEQRGIRHLLDLAYGGEFSDADWDHALGGTHALVRHNHEILAHGAVVARTLWVGEQATRVGYVEAIAVLPQMQNRGLGHRIMTALGSIIERDFELGVLATGDSDFYARFGWASWQGPTFIRHPDGTVERSADEDDGIMILRTARTPPLALTLPLTCEARPGDAW